MSTLRLNSPQAMQKWWPPGGYRGKEGKQGPILIIIPVVTKPETSFGAECQAAWTGKTCWDSGLLAGERKCGQNLGPSQYFLLGHCLDAVSKGKDNGQDSWGSCTLIAPQFGGLLGVAKAHSESESNSSSL